MGWQGDGTFVRTNGTNTGTETWQDDAAAATKIVADRHDTHDQDLADGIAACLTKNMETKPAADFVPATTGSYDIGTTSLKWEDAHFNGNTLIGGTLGVTGATTLTGAVTIGGNAMYPAVSGTATATTSGTASQINNLPATITKMDIALNAISGSGSEIPRIQFGDATTGGYLTSGHVTATARMIDASNPVVTSATGQVFLDATGGSARKYSGIVTLVLLDATNFIYSISGNVVEDDDAIISVAGHLVMAGLIDRVRVRLDGVETLDNGSWNIRYS